ncbi:MAG: hypothetical protein ACOVJ8_02675 [Sediminibacterium sp.]|jgi:hypothetical protein
MQNLRNGIYNKPFSYFGSFLNKCTKSKKLPLKSDTITNLFAFKGKEKVMRLLALEMPLILGQGFMIAGWTESEFNY